MKKFAATLALLAASAGVHANDGLNLSVGIGSFSYTGEVSATGFGSEEFDDSGSVYIFGLSKQTELNEMGARLSIPNAEDDSIMYVEGFYHHKLNDVAYIGGLLGLQNWTSEDDIGSLDMSGLSAGISLGATFNQFDLNYTYRFLNGSSDTVEIFGTDIDAEVLSTNQFSISYKLDLNK